MPIYEFKCLKCNECFELLLMNSDTTVEMKCPKCASEELERVLSCTNYSVGQGAGGSGGAKVTNRTCSSGSCTTYEIPGPNG